MSDTQDIDNKKNILTTNVFNIMKSNTTTNVFNMVKSIIAYIIIIIIYVYYSGGILFLCKLAQSNIVPTDSTCFPYTNVKPTITPITSNIFMHNTESMKINFPYDSYNSKNFLLDFLNKYSNKPTANFLVMYYIEIIQELSSFNYSSKNYVLNLMNSLPEVLILLLGPIIYNFSSFLILFAESFYFIYLWFSNMKWFFKTNTASVSDNTPSWHNITIYDPINFCIGLWLVFIYIIIFIIFGFLIPVLSSFSIYTALFCSFSLYGYQGKLNGKNIGVFGVGSELFKLYKITIMTIICGFVILSAYTNLGTYGLLYSLLSLIIIVYLHITQLFNPVHISGLSTILENVHQAEKICSKKNMMGGVILNGGAKKLIKEIKKFK